MNRFKNSKLLLCIICWLISGCFVLAQKDNSKRNIKSSGDLQVGAQQTNEYLPLVKGRKVAVVANHTSFISQTHLVDSLFALGANMKCVFAPEHGFRGEAGAGEKIENQKDGRTGLPLISLYGKHLKPTLDDLKDIEVVLFDIQDVGVRFYTYISTLQYVMEACAEAGIEVIVLDRPNPHGFYVDGPVLKKEFRSFIGLNSVPVVYGLTIGEYARMINEEGWLKDGMKCRLKVIPLQNYSHRDLYQLPIKPSPNLPNMTAVYLYPSLCFFEGTRVSVGRGTTLPFQLIGYPGLRQSDTSFTPHAIKGVASDPPYRDTLCNGVRLSGFEELYPKTYNRIYLFWLKSMYESYPVKEKFFIPFFSKLAGNAELQDQITKGLSEDSIRKSWQQDIDQYKQIRKKYLLYEDFEQ